MMFLFFSSRLRMLVVSGKIIFLKGFTIRGKIIFLKGFIWHYKID